jgi:hypothetical protein
MLYRNRINVGLTINALPYSIPAQVPIAPGTVMLFQQTTAPVGWTKLTSNNDSLLRVTSGTASSGGATAFSTVFTTQTGSASVTLSATTLSLTTMPSHSHFSGFSHIMESGYPSLMRSFQNMGTGAPSSSSDPVGGGQSHTHALTGTLTSSINLAVQYVDMIQASKN